MGNMGNIRMISALTTFFDLVIGLITAVTAIVCFVTGISLGALASSFGEYASGIDSSSSSAGYELIGSLFGSVIGAMFAGVMIVMGIVFAFITILYLVQTVMGTTIFIKSKKNPTIKMFKVDSIMKTCCHTVPTLLYLSMASTSGEAKWIIIFIAIIFCMVEAADITEIVMVFMEDSKIKKQLAAGQVEAEVQAQPEEKTETESNAQGGEIRGAE